ncbi:2'-5' RNA ligase family protein [Metabacillus schmidteae]|uniref:2'-5' RNA ligase family protein n=1 Tax=Metabacillus schmidteae TaxID=2730405 RepID=UPI00158AC6D2|nr:2'-5' RNA ligase family protein [Metabacillus schmidteae]
MSMTIGIASLLTGNERDKVLHFWNVFETEYKSIGVQSFEHPNIGFQGGSCLSVDPLKEELLNLCNKLSPFEILIDGFDFFETTPKVVYLKVIKTSELIELHKKINNLLEKCCVDLFELYTPANWVPHITLAMADLSETSFNEFKKKNRDNFPSFWQTISNLALVEFKENGCVELLSNFQIK